MASLNYENISYRIGKIYKDNPERLINGNHDLGGDLGILLFDNINEINKLEYEIIRVCSYKHALRIAQGG